MSESKTVRVVIEGRVQGVWYRGWTIEQAAARGLAGWVRNRSDGSVEAVFHGPAVTVDDMVHACHRGPPAASVARVSVEPSVETVGHDFHQRPTA
ncbi:acylphosphatase [Paramagnetospirillum marisnigri]|uniref:acylphosphatase n=1 Tax=Paramagnetospirillum marisnigri TaxID=1285242 RepID=A0A178MRN4_9PROT|nr:acylphosphatase [Paramagnetospirillum marisnigri]OAN52159.1 acylphosphatase [Paramagnetospirillum marisnigri]